MEEDKKLTGYPSIDKPWLKYYTKTPDDLPDPNKSMYEFLYENNKDRLDNTALNYFGRKTSYRQLFDEIDKTASVLKAYGVGKGDIVSLCALNTPEFILLMYAINKIGAVSNWIGLTSPESDLHDQLVSTNTRLVFTIDLAYGLVSKAAKNSNVEKIVVVSLENSMPLFMKTVVRFKNIGVKKKVGDAWSNFIKRKSEESCLEEIDPKGMAMIQYTGGSTGVPKGVMLSNWNLNSYYINFLSVNSNKMTTFEEKDSLLFGVPIFLAFGASSCCHAALCHSLELIVCPDPNPDAGIKMILSARPQHIIGGRVLLDELVKAVKGKSTDLSFIKLLMYGGEESNKDWERSISETLKNHKFEAPIINGYGMTETSAAIMVAPDSKTDGLVPFGNTVVKITDPDSPHTECGYDQEGELCLSSEAVMLGYFKNEKSTQEVLYEENGRKWIRTRDLAKVSSDGIVKITGRIKRIYSRLTSDNIQIRVYPMKIEKTILREGSVKKVAVVGIKDKRLAYRTVVYLVMKNDSENKKDITNRLTEYCKKNLPDSHMPDNYVIIDDFPLTRAGKVDYRKLEEMAATSLISVDK